MSKSKSNNKQHKSSKHDIIGRVRFLYFAFMVIGLGIAVRLIAVQIASPAVKHNAEVLREGVFRTTELPAHRGAILTRDGEPLAISSLRYNAMLDFASEGIQNADSATYYKNADSLSCLLALHFNQADAEANGYKYISEEGYRKILREQRQKRTNRSYKLFPRLVIIDEWNTLRNYPILNGNLGYVYSAPAEEMRLYPLGDVARQIIGRHTTLKDESNNEIKGKGIEYFYNDQLSGINGQVKEQWIAHGFWTRVDDPNNKLPEDGCDIITTIDAGLQRAADEYLREVLQQQNASFGVAIVMEVETGNILAMVNLSSGTERGGEYTERVENHALCSKMMPGSTMKLATTMALLEIGGYDLSTKVNTEHSRPGVSVKIGSAKVQDTHDAGEGTDGNVTLLDAFAHSSNVYFAKAVYELYKDKPEVYTDYLVSLRFNDYIGLQEYGEQKSNMPMAEALKLKQKSSSSYRLPRMAYGYELELPPIHMITFYNGVANDGRMMAPRFVDRIERNGEVIERMPTEVLIPKMCSDRTLDLLDSCLVAASQRTSNRFKDLPTTFGCKTGTAQMWSRFTTLGTLDHKAMDNGLNIQDEIYYGSIACIMPAENPKYTILVGVCKQKMFGGDPYYGILLAGPVANNIMTYIHANDPSLHATIAEAPMAYSPTKIKGGNSDDVATVSKRLSALYIDATEGSVWSSAKVDVGGNSAVTGMEFPEGTVPDVRGMGLSDALYLLESVGMEVTHSGYGAVRTQSIDPGKEITSDNIAIHLTLK
jgi:cell division protein FtsI (penicillin-binding protein 3)